MLRHRVARRDDADALRRLIDSAIGELQQAFLDARQIASSRAIMGLDLQLIDDGTYVIVEADDELAGCGGWSRRATLAGEPLYLACGYTPVERLTDDRGGAPVPLVRMRKSL